ncbi:MAG: hypothetical protein AAGF95_10575 [Chloroflexota bacterium]
MKSLLLLLMTTIVLGMFPATTTHAQSNERCFDETGFCISGPIREYWENNGGLAVFGYPTGPVETMTIENWTGPAQWFERDRLEDHSEEGIGVLAGRLGAERLEQLGRSWSPGGETDRGGDCRFFAETGYNMCGAFRAYWESNGGLERFGYPVTAEITEFIAGRDYTVQYFERRRMESHPENEPPFNVLLGLLGNETRANTPAEGDCATAVIWTLRGNYAEYNRNGALGCPLAGQDYENTAGSTARFERGQMYWVNLRGGQSIIVVVFYEENNNLSYQIFDDTWREGDPETADLNPPDGLFEPRRGFGKVWRDNSEVAEKIGWALENEQTVDINYQVFEGGSLMRLWSENAVWMFKDGTARNEVVRYN